MQEARRQATTSARGGGVAVLPLYGVIPQRANMVGDVSGLGSVSTQQFAAVLRQALADETVSQILIDIDSAGGSIYGASDLADQIVSARSQKPVVVIANGLAASAAYRVGCSASEFYVTPGGEVGAIGVRQAHVDHYYATVTKAIAPGRGVPNSQVRDGRGQWRVLGADAAMAEAMVHSMATFDELVRNVRRDAKPGASRLARARNALAMLG